MYTSSKFLVAVGSALASVGALGLTEENKLLNLNADPDTVTISGHSRGGYMSCHMLSVLSDTIKGAGCSKAAPITTTKKQRKNPTDPTATELFE